MNIVEFLLARIEEDERRLDLPEWDEIECARSPGWGTRNECPLCDQYLYPGTESSTEDGWYEHVDRSHRRILAECVAKREIIEHCKIVNAYGVLDILASVYADHPDFDPWWSE